MNGKSVVVILLLVFLTVALTGQTITAWASGNYPRMGLFAVGAVAALVLAAWLGRKPGEGKP